ncbi:hypothetical protein SELMODRAFT_152721 [Selaginella moellendorffii]|uniref:NADH-ubiquinone reductase complex 1 MLRQ subunit n=1 Tax=Selaginella moellendorffii TaxID=88036 RepID=D8S5N5_SELML|nr:uncharacterized protein LOC9653857 [Selaginella moellendorffii]EFJ14222.1 hypothetical protein SELMODRAFT_181102 [Selaginella moellendorffii]EFJ20086.1 hypothetical protein SELMODRAFT_152721 [Selaginella moellendorffii]|eukprot:XP_002978639.1 uncharacterized protein LOC9653857 [Selaginella moellendorffii]
MGVSGAVKRGSRWLKPEVIPLIGFIGAAMGLASFMCVRNLMLNPEVRINKEDRSAGLVQNYKEGYEYHEHGLRHYMRNRKSEIMPRINEYFTKTS